MMVLSLVSAGLFLFFLKLSLKQTLDVTITAVVLVGSVAIFARGLRYFTKG